MRDITEDEIRSSFGEKTFSRGLGYYEDRHVELGVKKGDNLIGTVQGSLLYPYKVEIDITDDIHGRCTCPVGVMCKHCVALLLQWVHDKDSFVDADYLLDSLRKKSKEELLKTISSLLGDDPTLASKLAFSEKVSENELDIKAISKRLRHLTRGFLDYYEVWGVARELEKIKAIGDNRAEEGSFTDAIEVYLLLIEWGVEAFESGVDDSDGNLGEVVLWCVEDFTSVAKELGEEQKKDVLYRILDIIEVEDYGLDTEEMLYGIAAKENMPVIEEELLKRVPTRGESYYVDYRRRKMLDLLTGLYEALGMQKDALRVIEKAGFENKNDYVRMAETLMNQGEHEKAFGFIRKGLSMEDGSIGTRLGDYYFSLLQGLLEEKRAVTINVKEAITTALQVLYHPFYFDPGRYVIMKDVFERMGECEKFITTIKEKCKEDLVINVLLYEDCLDEAIDIALTSSTLYSPMLVDVAEAAKKKGKTEAAKKVMYKALKQGLVSADAPVNELVKLVVTESDEGELKEAIDYIRNSSIARLFADALLERNQEYAVMVLKQFIRDIKKEEIIHYATNLENTYARELYHFWISESINRSHVYYDDAVAMLKMMRRITPEEKWENYISTFIEKNKGKKKLMEKLNVLF